MKREVQQTGVRKWHGDDLISLQSEPLKAIDAIVGQFGSCIVSGCGIVDKGNGRYDVGSGMVAIDTVDVATSAQRVITMPFAGVAGVALPIYLIADVNVVEKPYGDGGVKPVAYDYRAIATAIAPSANCITVNANGGARLLDVMQDALHRLVTDAEKTAWNGKASAAHTHAAATTATPGFMAAADKGKLDGIAPNANNYVHPNDATSRHVTDAQKTKLDGIAENANNYVHPSDANSRHVTDAQKTKLDGVADGANNYTHPSDANSRHVTDAEKTAWNSKPTTAVATRTSNGLMSAGDKYKLDFSAEIGCYGTVTHMGTRHGGSTNWNVEKISGTTGQYRVMRSVGSGVFSMVAGRDGAYASIIEENLGYIIVKTADSSGVKDAAFNFITYKMPTFQ